MSQLDPVQLTALSSSRREEEANEHRAVVHGSLDRDGYRMIGVKRFYETEQLLEP